MLFVEPTTMHENCLAPPSVPGGVGASEPERYTIVRLVVSKKAFAQYVLRFPDYKGDYKALAKAFEGVEVTRLSGNSPYFFVSCEETRYVFVVWKDAGPDPSHGRFTLVNIQERRHDGTAQEGDQTPRA